MNVRMQIEFLTTWNNLGIFYKHFTLLATININGGRNCIENFKALTNFICVNTLSPASRFVIYVSLMTSFVLADNRQCPQAIFAFTSDL